MGMHYITVIHTASMHQKRAEEILQQMQTADITGKKTFTKFTVVFSVKAAGIEYGNSAE